MALYNTLSYFLNQIYSFLNQIWFRALQPCVTIYCSKLLKWGTSSSIILLNKKTKQFCAVNLDISFLTNIFSNYLKKMPILIISGLVLFQIDCVIVSSVFANMFLNRQVFIVFGHVGEKEFSKKLKPTMLQISKEEYKVRTILPIWANYLEFTKTVFVGCYNFLGPNLLAD